MNDPAAGRHPLDVAGVDDAAVAHAVAMLDAPLVDAGDRLDPAVRVPGEAPQVTLRIIRMEIVEQRHLIIAEGALQVYAGSFNGRLALNNFADLSVLPHVNYLVTLL